MSITVRGLEVVMADGWRSLEEEHLGDWLLRASHGFTQRGNSALVLGPPPLPLPGAVDVVDRWYAARDLPTRFCLITDATGAAADPIMHGELLDRGYAAQSATLTMVAGVADLPVPTEHCPHVLADASLTQAWLAAFAAYRSIMPGVAAAILVNSRSQLFLSIPGAVGENPTAIARMSVYPGWAGIHAMWVDPAHRRRGLATTVVGSIGQSAVRLQLSQVYLQVERANDAAQAAYRTMGFRVHHGHIYLTREQPSAV